MPNQPLFELCVNSAASAVAAQTGGADRVELCENLFDGGTTPTAGTIATARRHLTIPMMVMIRPRGGDFLYSDLEWEVMEHDVKTAKDLGADGLVTGILTPDGRVDMRRMEQFMRWADPLPVTFHRAFDVVRDPLEALENLLDLGVARILTSGQESTAWEGADLIRELVLHAGDRLIILPGGGITDRNLQKLVDHTGVREVHFAALHQEPSGMQYRNDRVFMGGTLRPPEYEVTITDPQQVRVMRGAVSAH
ncbi:copper homeostasis protein [Catalinimonas alkaloidigena]|uniref:PF03932 family protein CutC n=1 Tax=Catalinimonas alkaloidigena TaxID=1075417 RepID=A0A1G8Y927_9BACT|nr:copper homeostasis protein CutC [Catalinimonas alkaloidigena]SDJ99187.1 copper homeostasis protein [Catalinimonas alkaloidigena]